MGPLEELTVVEMAGVGPGPFAAMLLADMGANVIRIDRADAVGAPEAESAEVDLLNRGRRSLAVDLKNPRGVETVLQIIESCDGLIEGFRPTVMERLGLGPAICLERNPALVYGRMTGWGQEGPYAPNAGHDLNYIALSGALDLIGEVDGPPIPPVNLVGDFGGGGMLLAVGMLAGLLNSRITGRGQVVDAAMVDGAALLTTCIHMLKAKKLWNGPRGANLLDGGAHYYGVYECADGNYVTVASGEPQFYAQLLEAFGLDPAEFPQNDESRWPEFRERFAGIIRQRTRAEWDEILGTTDVCFAPVLSPWEAHEHPHNKVRETFIEIDGIIQPNTAPRFSNTPSAVEAGPPRPGQHTIAVLRDFGFSDESISDLHDAGAVVS